MASAQSIAPLPFTLTTDMNQVSQFLIATCVILLNAACGNSLPPSQANFAAKLAELDSNLDKAKSSGNSANTSQAESAVIAFLRNTDHHADEWHAVVDSVTQEANSTRIDAKQGNVVFHILIADQKVGSWANSRVRGEKIVFSGALGKERSLTLSGGLREPEFSFYPSHIRLKEDASYQEQDPLITQMAINKEKQKIYESQASVETATACQKAVLEKLTLPEQASFSWLSAAASKTGEDIWTYANTVDAKNRLGATITHRFICNAKVSQDHEGEPHAKVTALAFR